jgi:predicted glycosyltransferase
VSRTIRVVSYAVNGTGLGHLTRLVAIQRWLRRYATAAGVNAEIYFLTSTEADGLLFSERFASFKLPSKTVVGDAGIDKVTYLALAKQWVWHSLGLLRPDLFVVDTFPRGSFGELLSAMDLCKKKAFIYRPTRDAFSSRPDFQAMLPLYDLILVPEHEQDCPVQTPEAVRSRVRYLGPIASCDVGELAPREEARAWFGVPQDRLCVYVSAGGGGDPSAESQLHTVCDALKDDPSIHLVVGAGPLYRGRPIFGERITWVTGGGVASRARAFDLGITAAGYNTVTEMMQAGVPLLLLPQEKGADDQAERAARVSAAGAGKVLSEMGVDCIQEAVKELRSPEQRARMSQVAQRTVPRTHAREAASELLHLVLPAHVVDAGEQALTDDALARLAALDAPVTAFAGMMRALEPRDGEPGAARPEAVSLLALATLEEAHAMGLNAAISVRMAERLSRKLASSTPEERKKALVTVLHALSPFGDWEAALAFVGALVPERQLAAHALAEALVQYLEKARSSGSDLYAAALKVARAQSTSEPALGNAGALT